MAKHNDTGKTGEAIAVCFLEDKGYEILATNWRFGKAEIDVIAKFQNKLIFVETKTRTSNHFGYPEDAVTPKKEGLLFEAGCAYMREIGYEEEIRFDIISIVLEPKMEIKHFEDAFFPGWG